MGLVVTSQPGAEPLLVADAKLYMHIDDNAWDDDIQAVVKSLRKGIEITQQRSLITQTWTWTFDAFTDVMEDDGQTIYVPRPPLQSITSIKYYDNDGAQQTWSSSKYSADVSGDFKGRIRPAYGESYPAHRTVMNSIEVIFVAGYGTAGTDCPESTILGLKMLTAIDFDRGSEINVRKVENMKRAADALIALDALDEAG